MKEPFVCEFAIQDSRKMVKLQNRNKNVPNKNAPKQERPTKNTQNKNNVNKKHKAIRK
jgi:hypothetical protein